MNIFNGTFELPFRIFEMSMDSEDQTRCMSIFEGVMSSTLGREVVNYFLKTLPEQEIPENLKSITEKLEKNQFSSVQKFLEDINIQFSITAKEIGESTDIGIAILHLAKKIEEQIKSTLRSENIQNTDIKDLSQIIQDLEIFIDNAPDNLTQFQQFLSNTSRTVLEFNQTPAKISRPQYSAVDPAELLKMIEVLKEDGQVSKVIDIITHYEISYQHIRNVLEIDLAKCSPMTLNLVRDYILKCSNSTEPQLPKV